MPPELASVESALPAADPSRLLADLPTQWRGDVVGPGIEAWDRRIEAGRATTIALDGLPTQIRTELAWMAHWQFGEGSKVCVSDFNQAAAVLRWMLETPAYTVDSILDLDADTFTRRYRSWFESRHGRLPAVSSMTEMQRVLFGYPRKALIARSSDLPWWALDEWIPRCDPRIGLILGDKFVVIRELDVTRAE